MFLTGLISEYNGIKGPILTESKVASLYEVYSMIQRPSIASNSTIAPFSDRSAIPHLLLSVIVQLIQLQREGEVSRQFEVVSEGKVVSEEDVVKGVVDLIVEQRNVPIVVYLIILLMCRDLHCNHVWAIIKLVYEIGVDFWSHLI